MCYHESILNISNDKYFKPKIDYRLYSNGNPLKLDMIISTENSVPVLSIELG